MPTRPTTPNPNMSKFSNLQRLNVSEKTSWCDLPELGADARLELKPASEANKPYFNALLKQSAKRARAVARGAAITADVLSKNRDEDRVLYSEYVVKGWEGIVDAQNKLVPFSNEDCVEFLKALPDWLFDRIRNHASAPENYVEFGDVQAEGSELAGN